jgi:hypothetical protein
VRSPLGRAAVVAVLLAGAAGSARSLLQNREALATLLRADDGSGWGYASLEPVATFIRDDLPPGAHVAVASYDDEPWIWMRYLAYPAPVEWLPLGSGPALARLLPPGDCWIAVALEPGRQPDARTLKQLSARVGASSITAEFHVPGGPPLYRVTR